MKLARFFAYLFGILGTVVMVFSILLCLTSLDREAQLKNLPAGAEACAQGLMEAAGAGDFAAASQFLYGQPDLGGKEPESIYGTMVWDACRGSFSYTFLGDCYAAGERICRDVSVTYLDVPSVTRGLSQRAHSLLTARVEAAEDMAELYDEQGDFREDLLAEVLQDALVRCLAEDSVLVTGEVTLTLLQEDGRWWAVAEEGFYKALSGGVE